MNDEYIKFLDELKRLVLAGAALVPLYLIQVAGIKVPYNVLILAAYSGLLLVAGFAYKRLYIPYVGCAALSMACYYAVTYYPQLMTNHDILHLMVLLGGLSVIFSMLYFALQLIRNETDEFFMWVKQIVGGLALLTPFIGGRAVIIFGAHYYHLLSQAKTRVGSILEYFTQGKEAIEDQRALHISRDIRNYALVVYYGITGLLLILGGFAYKKRYIRYAGLFLFFVTLIKLLLIISTFSNTLTRMVAFLIVGSILIFASLVYQRIAKSTDRL
jgi:hypothetical protein